MPKPVLFLLHSSTFHKYIKYSHTDYIFNLEEFVFTLKKKKKKQKKTTSYIFIFYIIHLSSQVYLQNHIYCTLQAIEKVSRIILLIQDFHFM